jgi:hypothetical protein
VPSGKLEESSRQTGRLLVDIEKPILEHQSKVDGNLIVPAPTGMDPFPRLADLANQPRLDRRVGIFVLGADHQSASIDRLECPPKSSPESTMIAH